MSGHQVDAAVAAPDHENMPERRSTESGHSSSSSSGDSSDAGTLGQTPGNLIHDPESSTAPLNELAQGQPTSLPTLTGPERRPREGKEPERDQHSTDNSIGSSEGASSSRRDGLGAPSEFHPLQRRRFPAQSFDDIELPAGERIGASGGHPSPYREEPVLNPAINQQQIPTRSASNIQAGEGSSGAASTVQQAARGPIDLSPEAQRQFQEGYLRVAGTWTPSASLLSRYYVHNDERLRSASEYGGSDYTLPNNATDSRGPTTPVPAEIVLPRWQPDAEVTLCPICGTQFSFFVRKHHCRKCGRVVCNACSPHRITIPYQFIVQPPNDPGSHATAPRPQQPSALHSSPSSSDVAGLGGGERVRLCNPCVPDPNIAPPQSRQREAHLQPSPLSISHNRSSSLALSSASFVRQDVGEQAYRRRHRQLEMDVDQYGSTAQPASQQSSQDQGRRSTISTPASASNSRVQGSTASANQGIDDRGNANIAFPNIMTRHNLPIHMPAHIRQLEVMSTRREEDLRRQEERFYRQRWAPSMRRSYLNTTPQDDSDLCPVCHQRLPTRSHDQAKLDALREAHINECIEAAIRGSTSSPPVPTAPQPSVPSSSLPSSSLHPSASTAASRSAAREQAHAAVVLGRPSPSPLPRRTGLFPYDASEKDCVDDAECTICFEEFEVGDKMGRLECFCRFHFDCIMRWFQTHPGQCPVHQHGSGY